MSEGRLRFHWCVGHSPNRHIQPPGQWKGKTRSKTVSPPGGPLLLAWPAPTSYCSASQGASVSSCLQEACSATPTAVTSYRLAVVLPLLAVGLRVARPAPRACIPSSAPAFTGNWNGPGNWGDRHRGHGDDNDDDDWGWDHDWDNDGTDDRDQWDQYTRTWSGGSYTVTGCEWNGNVWAGGPGGCAPGGAGGSPWGPWGRGWTWSTVTQTVTRVVTVTDTAGATALSTSVGLAAVALAASGDVTSTSVIGAVETGAAATGGASGGDGNANPTGGVAGAAGRNEALGVKVAAVMLGGVVAVAAWL
ncbi:predicted protein [Chaetomium globosum CBS 148.51]|uniref:Uncharacterized protein n=1 Tax=Chaetomium globosum (strain ATCC 6205 / CBS 148.51 / DSM 1962 / NBRC 6347 / NRRL 1970) TaxID=306901 RepID=Q2H4D5_CHAGB|nr:uncharacterized protein CHGG_06480 [Chaetomium globosum CBS 148.51]EAQ89861.1 predicted protein [Chaetomium globosum CBS 148.51]